MDKMIDQVINNISDPAWLQQHGLQLDGTDYVKQGNTPRDARGHLPDGMASKPLQGKLPWHPTFSDESPYSTPEHPGGHWNQLPPYKDKWSYQPSRYQVQQGYTGVLANYFRNVEKGNILDKPPIPYSSTVYK